MATMVVMVTDEKHLLRTLLIVLMIQQQTTFMFSTYCGDNKCYRGNDVFIGFHDNNDNNKESYQITLDTT